MKLYLNAESEPHPIGQAARDIIAGLGFAGVRQSVPVHLTDEQVYAMLAEWAADDRLQPILLLGEHEQQYNQGYHDHSVLTPEEVMVHAGRVARIAVALGHTNPPMIELVNEPDLGQWKYNPGLYHRAVLMGYAAVRERAPGVDVIAGGISNLDRDSLDYLATALAGGWPDDLIIGYHRYPVDFSGPEKAHRGFAYRIEEFAALRRIAGTRRILCTETGYHLGPQDVRYIGVRFCSRRWTEAQQAEYLAAEIEYHRVVGAEGVVIYQLNSGPHDTALDLYGITRYDGSLRSAAHVAKVAR